MKYENIKEGIFVERPNRFIAYIEIDGKVEICHVKNTGRCKELLIKGSKVFVEKSSNPNRKTKYDLIAVYKGKRLINMDSQVPNKVAYEYLPKLFKDIIYIKPETKYGNSRFDFYVETATDKIFMEVKGVTLEEDGLVKFPDAPTERGVKHINELIEAAKEGYKAYILFVIQMKDVKYFTPNIATHKEFGEALKNAQNNGVNIIAIDCKVSNNSIVANNIIKTIIT